MCCCLFGLRSGPSELGREPHSPPPSAALGSGSPNAQGLSLEPSLCKPMWVEAGGQGRELSGRLTLGGSARSLIQGLWLAGILTKPDLVDKGTEDKIVDVARNLVFHLKKGYMIVKCRGQQDIQDQLSLAKALQKEQAFFENHEHFRYAGGGGSEGEPESRASVLTAGNGHCQV